MDTQAQGLASVTPKLPSMHAKVLSLFQTHGDMTDVELVDAYVAAYGPGLYRSISTRRRELVDKGSLRDTGERKLNPASNVKNVVWGILG